MLVDPSPQLRLYYTHRRNEEQRWLILALGVASIAAAFAQTPTPEYRLEPGDSIEVRFYYTPDMNDHMLIRPDGCISLALIGTALAAGKTVPELTAYLEDRYAKLLKHPSISVQVQAFANRRIFVGGEVTRPGMLPLVGEETVLGAIVEAGGLTKQARSN